MRLPIIRNILLLPINRGRSLRSEYNNGRISTQVTTRDGRDRLRMIYASYGCCRWHAPPASSLGAQYSQSPDIGQNRSPVNRRWNAWKPSAATRLRRFSSSTSLCNALASSTAEFGSTKTTPPSAAISGIPPTRVATTGIPQAIASIYVAKRFLPDRRTAVNIRSSVLLGKFRLRAKTLELDVRWAVLAQVSDV